MPALQSFIASSISVRLWAAIVAPLANAMIINSSEWPPNEKPPRRAQKEHSHYTQNGNACQYYGEI